MTASAPRVLRTGALAAAALTVAASFAAPPSTADHMLPLLDRDAVGAVDQFGGARRFTGDQSSVIAGSIEANRAKNVILIIGDGMGDSEIHLGRPDGQGPPDDPAVGEGDRARHGRRVDVRDPGRDTGRPGRQHFATQVLWPLGHHEELP